MRVSLMLPLENLKATALQFQVYTVCKEQLIVHIPKNSQLTNKTQKKKNPRNKLQETKEKLMSWVLRHTPVVPEFI